MMNQERFQEQRAATNDRGTVQPSLDVTTVDPASWSKLALIVGGSLLVVMYTLEIIFGLQTGRMPDKPDIFTSTLTALSLLSAAFGLAFLAIGLIGIGMVLHARAPKLATAGIAVAVIPLLATIINLGLIAGGRESNGLVGGLSVLANLASATLLGIAVFRSRALPRRIGLTLLVVGLITFPCILATIPLEAMLPEYVIADLPFPTWGAIFVGLGVALLRRSELSAPTH